MIEAENYLRKAVQLCRAAAERHPAVPKYQRDLAFSKQRLAMILTRRMKLIDAEKCFRQAFVVVEQEVAKNPEQYSTSPTTDFNLWWTAENHEKDGSNRRKAEEYCQKAVGQARLLIKLYEKQVAEEPDNLKHKASLGDAYYKFVRIMQEQDDLFYPFRLQPMPRAEDSLKWLDLASEMVGESKESNTRSQVYATRALVLTNLEQHRRAIEAWDEAIAASTELWRPDLQVLKATARIQVEPVESVIEDIENLTDFAHIMSAQYNMACVYALASGRSEDKRTEYSDRAMELLRAAVEGDGPRFGPFWHETPALDAIRERQDFQQLVERTTTPIQTAQ